MKSSDGKLIVSLLVILIVWGTGVNFVIVQKTSHDLFEPIVIEFATRLEEVELNYQHKFSKPTP
jgi:hypothetical protein